MPAMTSNSNSTGFLCHGADNGDLHVAQQVCHFQVQKYFMDPPEEPKELSAQA